MSSTVAFDEEQLKAARVKAWHQGSDEVGVEGEAAPESAAIVTIEAAREWINRYGLVLFAPRPQMADAPAPTFVEATLGKPTPAPTMVETEIARSLVARLVSDGSVVPLNLLGVAGDAPDFVVSAQVFSYVFTMRGDKAWKQPPSTSGAVKVSPLGLRVYEVLTERGALTAQELAQELGREVTETAILRALSELWSQLRVLPLVQLGREVTLWELTSKRFTKTIKAGANAGQPSALSALVSLYLAQVFAATEEEIATFLSPLTARSRVREVLHALMGARQLETLVVHGKTLVHIPGAIPAFPEAAAAVDAEGEPVASFEKPKKIGTGRISSFTSETKAAGEFRGKAAGKVMAGARKSASGARPPARAGAKTFGAKTFGAKTFGTKPASKYGPRLDGKTDPQRRPFKKDGAAAKPTFSKPWDEEKKARPAKAAVADGFTKFRKPAPEDREPLGPREQAGLPPERRSAPKATKSFDRGRPAVDRKPAFGASRAGSADRAGGFAKRPYAAKSSDGAAKPYAKRPYTPRTTEDAERPTFKPRSYEKRGSAEGNAFAEKKSFGDKKPYAAREGGFAKKPYAAKSFGDKPYAAKASDGPARPYAKKAFAPRTEEGGERPAFKPTSFGTKNFADKKSFGDKAGGFAKKPYAKREGSSFGAAKPYAKRAAAPRGSDDFEATPVERTIPKRPFKPRAADADSRKFTKAPWTPDEGGETGAAKKRAFKPRAASAGYDRAGSAGRKSFGAKPAGRLGGKPGDKPSGKPSGFKKPFAPRKPKA